MIDTMAIVMQWVRTSWTKNSRGAPAATVRNAAPVAFELPDVGRAIVHEVTMKESSHFHASSTMRDLPPIQPRMTMEGVSLTQVSGVLHVLPVIPPHWSLPPLHRRPPAARLEPGQWLRWQLNYRFSSLTGMGDWSYHLHTLNLAYGLPEPDIFLGTPTRYIDERGSLR
ncbi:hypothetical protein ACFYO1_01865 [Nocardia sp. NPDC006044]|uniref:hypothetical protein n=1 Tax=Nocardia sp. NPDC006044 TaxID=3364306 RepID=UPI0036ACE07B